MTGVTLTSVLASGASFAAGMVAVQLPSVAGVTDTGSLVLLPSLAETETSVASGCATPDTVSAAPLATVRGALVISFRAQGATELQPEIGPRIALDRSPGVTTALADVEPLPSKPP
jgi:hypothetical protein